MRYSLINVYREVSGFVDGVWIVDCTGTIDTASRKSKSIERANGNKIVVAVVESLNYSSPNFCFRTGLKRLND